MNNKNFTYTFCFVLIAVSLIVNLNTFATKLSLTDSTKTILKFKDNRPNRPIFNPEISTDFQSFMLKISAVKPGTTINKNSGKNTKSILGFTNEVPKPLDNVKIYPNPVSDQLNLSYTLSKENLVTIKVLDVLGNEVATLLSQKLAAGEQSNSFNLNSKLSSGLYFVRVIAGSESVIKRISVL